MAMTIEERNAYFRAYYQKNKEWISKYQRWYYRQRKEKHANYNRERYQRDKAGSRARVKSYYDKNREKYADEQACIRTARISAGLSSKEVAGMIGKTRESVCLYERGCVPAPWELLETAIPGLKEARKNVQMF